MQHTSTENQPKTSTDPKPSDKPQYVAYFAPDDENPIAVIREDHLGLSNTHFRTEIADFENVKVLPLKDAKFPVTPEIKAAIKSVPVTGGPKVGSDAAKEAHENAVRYDENTRIQDEQVREQARQEAVKNAPKEHKAEVQKAVDKASADKHEAK